MGEVMEIEMLFVVMSLTAWRLTRFAVADTLPFVAVPRNAIAEWLDPREPSGASAHPVGQNGTVRDAPFGRLGRWVAYLLTCSWCMSFWMALNVVGFTDYSGVSVPRPALMVGAVWAVAGWLSAIEFWAEERWRLAKNQRYAVRHGLGLPYVDESEMPREM